MERIDGTCEWPDCEQPGELIIDPYAQEINGITMPVIWCAEHEQIASDEI